MSRTAESERFIPGSVLAGRYRVVERVGAGGMGEVYRAMDLKLGSTVALKFLALDVAEDRARLQALFDEVRLARQVSHPNVGRVHDVGEVDGTHFLSMEFVDGEDLASLLRRIGRLPADKALEITREICAGLGAIHARGVLHRDLKPGNVMIDGQGHARITDFGLAQLQSRAESSELITGTPPYMSPETLLGEPATVRSDLYSLGCLMVELFTGRPAFEPAPLGELIRQRREVDPVPPSRYRPDLDAQVERVILRCLERDPAKRPASAAAVAAALPVGDPLSAAISAGRTPSPEALVAASRRAETLAPWQAWACLGLLSFGLTALTMIAPHTRLAPALDLPESPALMTERARDLLHGLQLRRGGIDHAVGFDFDEAAVDRIVADDHSPLRWDALPRLRPPVAAFWYRESATDLQAAPPWNRVTYADPAWAAGMAGVKLDGHGRLLRFDGRASGSGASADSMLDPDALFAAAGLDRADFRAAAAGDAPIAAGDERHVFAGHERGNRAQPLEVELVQLRGRPVAFEVRDPRVPRLDPARRTTGWVSGVLKPGIFLAALLLGAWLARRNLRAGRGDPRRAVRVALGLATLRVLVWLLGAHHAYSAITTELMTLLAWALYDFAYGWVFYMAIEPYARRLWPRLLISWARLVDGRFSDSRVGRELLVGCLAGTLVALLVAGHQAAPMLFGAPPGRPDNVGYVPDELNALLGLRPQLAGLFLLFRSSLILAMGFLLILLMSRIILRHALAAVIVSFLLFVPLALPKGELSLLDSSFAVVASALLAFTMFRFGLLAVVVALITHAALESAPLGMGLGSWPTRATVLVLALVLGAGLYGFSRSLGGRASTRDLLAE